MEGALTFTICTSVWGQAFIQEWVYFLLVLSALREKWMSWKWALIHTLTHQL
jgi:hypothetical protein